MLQANEVDVVFPDSISFHLSASVPDPVESVALVYGIDRVACRPVSSRITPEVEAEEVGLVSASWTWELRRSGSVPPGARIWWQWHLVTEGGESWSTPVAWFTFDDDRYAWKTETQGDITVHWYAGDREFGRRMLQVAVEAQSRLTADPGAQLEEPVDLYFYADAGDLKGSIQFAQSWTGGVAFPDYYAILIAAGPDAQEYGETTVAHELMHLVVRQLAFSCSADLPRWLDEGLAVWAEGPPDEHQEALLAAAIAVDRLLSLRSISSSFSAHANRAGLAYAQSYSVVAFLIEQYGRERILDLLAAFHSGATYDGALAQVYDLDTDRLEDLWRAGIGAAPRPTPLAPRASPSAVPTRELWVEPATTVPPATATPAATAVPTETEVPERATVAVREAPSPTPTGRPVAHPTPIGGGLEQEPVAWWLWIVSGTMAAAALLITAGVIGARRRWGRGRESRGGDG
ncbi:MAG TPA: peptidase MA family metallohydrolase [Anaerolineae bacterium]|nr:peptidase MA family metallohydrolase [Anaerolineae bacterium]